MSNNTSEISQLANILHQNGDKVLNALSKLSLNAVLLQKLNRKFDLFLDNLADGEASFHVITPTHGSSQLLKDLHFLHDFIQKTLGLKISNNPSLPLLNDKIDLRKFKNLKYLEIKKIPVKKIIGLESLQSQLESIVCIRCLQSLTELLAECGGDNTTGFVWSELKEAVLSFNNIHTIDTSIAFAPWLQVLDLSHNQITDVKAIECLPNLRYVNLSFNCLDLIPTFNKSARKKIELLVMKNNYVEDLSGVNCLSNLTKLDISDNWIARWDSLAPLLLLSTLQCLCLAGNPISCHNFYRLRVAEYLHISASFGNFYLDQLNLSKKEKTYVGIQLCDRNALLTKSFVEGLSKETFKKKSPTNECNAKEQTSGSRKSGKARVVVIPNLDDGTYEEPTSSTNTLDLSANSSMEYLIAKKRIENTRSTYGVDNWLVQGSSVVQDILGLPPVHVSTSTPCDDMCLKAALGSLQNIVTTVAVIETPTNLVADDSDKNNVDSFTTCNEGDNTSNYFSAETSTEKGESNNNKNKEELVESGSHVSKEISPDIEEIKEEDEEKEEVELDENEKLYVVLKQVKKSNNTVTEEEMFLTITDSELQERETIKGKISTKWCLTSLESCEKLKSNKLQLVFDTVRRDKRERIYCLEAQEADALYKQMSEILESRTLSDMNQIVYKCENCDSQFSFEIKSRKSESKKYCPFCHSKFILQLDEDPLPSSESEKKILEVKNKKNCEVKTSHNRSSSASGFFQSLLNQSEDKMLKCSSQSSIGSATSLEGITELPPIQNNKRSDSDIEILSNPSQSSIEVLDGPSRSFNESGPKRKISYEERQDNIPVSVNVVTSLSRNNQPVGLTESSSSGSVTDSVCTAYESSSAAVTNTNKSDGVQNLPDDSKNKDTKTEPILQEVLKCMRKTMNSTKEIDTVKYSYSDFTCIDHRIKLFLYTHVFDDASEEFSFGIRAVIHQVGADNADTPFPACITISNKNLYFLKVSGKENGDDARNFLQKSDALSFNLNSVTSIFNLAWHQGFGIKIKFSKNKWKNYLILLMDPVRTRNFFTFITSLEGCSFEKIQIVKEAEERPYWAVQHLLLSSTSLEDANIQYFCLFNSCSISTNQAAKDIQYGGILMNSTELILLVGHLNWLIDGTIQPPNLEYFQKFRNLVQVYTNTSVVILQFYDGIQETEVWSLIMEGENSIEELLDCIRDSWQKLFAIPLQISSF